MKIDGERVEIDGGEAIRDVRRRFHEAVDGAEFKHRALSDGIPDRGPHLTKSRL